MCKFIYLYIYKIVAKKVLCPSTPPRALVLGSWNLGSNPPQYGRLHLRNVFGMDQLVQPYQEIKIELFRETQFPWSFETRQRVVLFPFFVKQRGTLVYFYPYIYLNNYPPGKMLFAIQLKAYGVSLDPSWPPGSENVSGISDFRPWSAWEPPTGSWRTWARTSPGIEFLRQFLKPKLSSMIILVIWRCFRTARTILITMGASNRFLEDLSQYKE